VRAGKGYWLKVEAVMIHLLLPQPIGSMPLPSQGGIRDPPEALMNISAKIRHHDNTPEDPS